MTFIGSVIMAICILTIIKTSKDSYFIYQQKPKVDNEWTGSNKVSSYETKKPEQKNSKAQYYEDAYGDSCSSIVESPSQRPELLELMTTLPDDDDDVITDPQFNVFACQQAECIDSVYNNPDIYC